jgi:LPPG:FO 2-phospho-L-lactate transferase
MLDVVGAEQLTVVANTGDDLEIYGAYVSPDPDLITFRLADRLEDRGWGLAQDTFNAMAGLRDLGVEVWFNLGDRDLAVGLERRRMLDAGIRLTEAHARIARALGAGPRVLPMSDRPVRTRILAHDRWWPLQEFLIRARGRGPVQDVSFRGVRTARPTPEVLESIANACAIVVGPSNPAISIGPILALPGMGDAIEDADAAVVAVSPLVHGEVLKGPTAAFMQWGGHPLSNAGIAAHYDGLIDGLVADERVPSTPTLEVDVLMGSAEAQRRLAEAALQFALALR